MDISTVMERELYSELGTLAAAYRIESRRHTRPAMRHDLEWGAQVMEDIRSRFWVGKLSAGDTVLLLLRGRAILEAVTEWDAV